MYENKEEQAAYEAGMYAAKENSMENGAIGASDAATLALLYGGNGGYGRGGGIGVGAGGHYGGGSLYTGNNVLAAEAHANGTATKEAIDGNADLIRAQANNFENQTRAAQVAGIQMQTSDQTTRICDRLNTMEINSLRDQADSAAALAKCCCDSQLATKDTQALVLAENSATRELIQANALKEVERELDKSDRANNTNTTIGAITANANSNTAAIVAAINANGNGRGRG